MSTTHRHWAARASLLGILAVSPFVVDPRHGAHAAPNADAHHADAHHADAYHADALLGEWWTEGNEGRVLFTRHSDGTFRGTTTCCTPANPSPKKPATDIHNPDPKLRHRSTLGIVIIWQLAYEGGEYSGGYVYNPRDGKTYRLAAEVVDRDTVRVRGYIGIPLLGQSQIWKRARTTKTTRAH